MGKSKCLLILLVIVFCVVPVQAQDGTRVEQAVAWMAVNNIPSTAYADLAAASGYQEISAVLAQYGYTDEQLRAFITDMNLLLLDNALAPQPSDDLQVRALTLLQSYGLNGLDLQALGPLANDPAAIQNYLMQKGLTAEQVGQLLEQFGPLMQEGAAQGLMQYDVINARLSTSLRQAGIPATMLYASAHLLDDPAGAAAYLTRIGYSAEQVETFVALLPDLAGMGITPDVVEGWTIRSMIYRLEGLGLPPQSIYEVVALGNSDVVRGYLIGRGLGGDVLELAVVQIGGCMGKQGEILSPERLVAFQTREARTLLDSAGIDPADLVILLPLANSPAALSAYLSQTYGMDEAQTETFAQGLTRSTFVKTVDPNDAGAFIATLEGTLAE